MSKKVMFLGGLPRSGSTLLCNLINLHPNVAATSSSPLCNIVSNMKGMWSDDPFFLSQLDDNFDDVYKRLERSTRAFIETWSDNSKDITVDKNRRWVQHAELLRSLYPDVKIIVTIRDLRNIFSSVERVHRKTLLLDFPDHMDPNIPADRMSVLFANRGIIGGPVRSLRSLHDIPDISKHIYIWKYEAFLRNPKECMESTFNFIGVDNFEIDFNNIQQTLFESDSHYRMKWPHSISSKVMTPDEDKMKLKAISNSISSQIIERNKWYFEQYYPELSLTEEQVYK